ncbi:hypothetical protein VS868_03725 [Salinimicrobium sp. 3283s]|uniref:hypothetical protein n=1 Tax=Salinimicrobium sp. 3283s TaxID=3114359 RepID=UPI0031E94B73
MKRKLIKTIRELVAEKSPFKNDIFRTFFRKNGLISFVEHFRVSGFFRRNYSSIRGRKVTLQKWYFQNPFQKKQINTFGRVDQSKRVLQKKLFVHSWQKSHPSKMPFSEPFSEKTE